jgi:cobalt-precorrin-5B (C1)-methyltransferase
MNRVSPTFNPVCKFDLKAPAANGLQRGFTTGTSATAATKAALTLLLSGTLPAEVRVSLPDGLHYLPVPISPIPQTEGWASASVIKDGGDDPDQTHRARIISRVRRNQFGDIVFLRGKGVGVVTQPGLRIPIGEPAINAVPRAMMRQAVSEVLESDEPNLGLDIEIGCENGEQIAKRTFNPRLGIVDGISILGTTGIVEPKSLASFMASIEVYVRVALGDSPSQIVLSPGNLGQRFARSSLQLQPSRIVQMSNFVGFAIDTVSDTLKESGTVLPLLWVVGHPGKLAKLLLDEWDTHSNRGASAVDALTCTASHHFPALTSLLLGAPSTEAVIERLHGHAEAGSFWRKIEDAIGAVVRARVEHVDRVQVRLFGMDGTPLGGNP